MLGIHLKLPINFNGVSRLFGKPRDCDSREVSSILTIHPNMDFDNCYTATASVQKLLDVMILDQQTKAKIEQQLFQVKMDQMAATMAAKSCHPQYYDKSFVEQLKRQLPTSSGGNFSDYQNYSDFSQGVIPGQESYNFKNPKPTLSTIASIVRQQQTPKPRIPLFKRFLNFVNGIRRRGRKDDTRSSDQSSSID